MINLEGAAIELCMDSGEIRAGKQSRPISEIELELKSGESLQLFKFALALLDIVPFEIEHTSKAEYGYLLHYPRKSGVSKGNFPTLSKSPDVATALQSMINACLEHLQANISGAIQQLDEEYLHQVRVALRRLRVVLAITESLKPDDELSALHEFVAVLCVELGILREWDVFVTQTLVPMHARLSDEAALKNVFKASEKLREQHHASVESRLQSQEYQRYLLRFGAWMHGNYWREPIPAIYRF